MKKLLSLPIRLQLFIIVFIMAIFSFGIIVYSGINLRNEKIDESLKSSAMLADIVAGENVKMAADMQQLMTALVHLPEVRNLQVKKIESALRNVLSSNPKYSNIFIADRTGKVVASAVPSSLSDVSDRRYFKNALSSGRFSSGEYMVSRFTGKPVFAFSYPFKDKRGKVTGIIVMGIDMSYYKALLDTLQLPYGSSYLLLDHKGIIMNRGINPSDFVGQQYNPAGFKRMADGPERDNFVAVAHDGIKRFISYRKLQLEGEKIPYIYVRAGIPVDSTLSQANKILMRNLGLLTVSLCLVVFLVLFIIKRSIIDRIALLERASRHLAYGDLQVKVSDLITGGELGQLSRTFDHMTEEIGARETALRQSELRYHALFDQSPDGVVIVDLNGRIVEFNDAACRQLGYSREEFSRLSISDIDQDERQAEIRCRTENILEEGSAEFDSRHRTRLGEIRYVHIITKVILLAGESLLYAIWQDITDRKKADEAMVESEERYRALFDQSPDGILLIDTNGRMIDFNDSAHRKLGYTREEFAQLGIPDLNPFENTDEVTARIGKIMREGRAEFDVRHRTKQGALRDVHVITQIIMLSGRPVVHAIWHDMTEIRNTQDRLEEKTAEQNAILENAIVGMAFLKDRRFIWINSRMEQMFGYGRDEVSGLTTAIFYPSQENYEQFGKEAYPLLSRGDTYSCERLMKRKDGSAFWCSLSGKAIDSAALDKGSIWILQDITERTIAEEALRNSEERLSKAQKMAHVGNWEWNVVEDRIYWSDEVYRIYGVDPERYVPTFELVGKAMHPDDLGPFLVAVDAALHQQKPYEMDYRLVRPDGTERTVHTIGEVLRDPTGKPVIKRGTVQDITDYKKAEEQLRAALGEKETLLRELYHRTKNNMQVIMSLINLQIASVSNKQDIDFLNDTLNRIMSMALVHEKLYGSRDLSNVNLKDYIEDLANALLRSYQIDTNKIVHLMEIDDLVLSIDTIMPIGLIINELMTNTLKYAFPENGQGEIRISAHLSDKGEIEITYGDNGIGFPAGFDFRKTDSLGLQLVCNLVESQLQGRLMLNTGEGAEFAIVFKEATRKKRI